MTEKPLPERSIERKKREAAALKANLKKRKAPGEAPAVSAGTGESENN